MTLDLATEQPSISALFLLRTYRACQQLGARRPVLLQALDFQEAKLRDPSRYFDPTALLALLGAASRERPNACILSNIAANMIPAGFSDPGFLALFQPNMGIVLQKAIQSQRLGVNRTLFRLESDHDGDFLVWDDSVCQLPELIRLGFSLMLGSLHSLDAKLLCNVRQISLAENRPKDWDEDFLHFGDEAYIRISFDQPHNRVEFDRGFFERANGNHNDLVITVSNQQRGSSRWKHRPHSKSCYDYLTYLLDKPGPNLDSAAETFSMAERTLRRRLVAEKTSFREILELVRRDICQLYFLEGKRQLSKISTLLGYSELSAFTRAYTGWYGHPPSRDAWPQSKLAA